MKEGGQRVAIMSRDNRITEYALLLKQEAKTGYRHGVHTAAYRTHRVQHTEASQPPHWLIACGCICSKMGPSV